MKPVVICRYAPHEGPGYFATHLTRARIPWRVLKIDEGEPLPPVEEFAGLAMMGGAMSANDELPWIPPMLALARSSVEAGVPVIGHCLGGQLLAKALGGSVTRNPVKEIGWGEIEVLDTPVTSEWTPPGRFVTFQWHEDTFSVPRGAHRIWSSTHCGNQAFVMGGHIGMQCHIEITAEMIETWCETGADEIEQNLSVSPAVQRPAEMRENLEERLAALRRVADRIYDRWIAGLNNSQRFLAPNP